MKQADPNLPLPVVCAFDRTSKDVSEVESGTPDSPDQQSASSSPIPPRPARYLPAQAILHAASDRSRWIILRELSKGQPMAIRELSNILKISPGLASKHVSVLRNSGVINVVNGQDARHRYHSISPDFVPRVEGNERVLDFGSCVLRFPLS